MFIRLLVARNCYIDDFQFINIHWSNSILNYLVDVSNYFIDLFCYVDVQINSFGA